MELLIKYLSDILGAYKKMLISSQIPPEKIPGASANMKNNVAALIVSGIFFAIARSLVGTQGGLFAVAALNFGLIVGVMGTIMLVQTVGLLIPRNTTSNARRVDQWGTFLVFVWTFSLVALVADHLLMTLGWIPGIHSLAGQLTDGGSMAAPMASAAIYSLFALALLTFKTHRQNPGFRPGSYAVAAITALCSNTALVYLFVYQLRDV
ncbi:hypothetical protein [Ancylobacter vacuolatus]|uniref:Uncharacterized protein n=1 Tax=Ancylobacter vacuolatus TaxID=223389 RepID=A0ABU0DF67_9HYPH|nr:hypothetical protein [Ancylobacter vacuolatus]MDQ0347069.1 hypothetical protein [Ancylobacter vacuolatus]